MSDFPTTQQKEIIWKALTGLAGLVLILLGLGVASLVLYGIVFFQSVLIPLALAAMVAFILDPVIDWLVGRGMSREWAVGYVFILVAILLVATLAFVVPVLYAEILRVISALPDFLKWLGEKWQSFYERYKGQSWAIDGNQLIAGLQEKGLKWLQETGPTVAQQTFALVWSGFGRLLSVFSLVIGLLVIPIYVYYFLSLKPHIQRHWRKYVPLTKSKFRDETVSILSEVRMYLAAFFRGQLVNAIVLGIFATIGLTLVDLNYAILIGIMTGILSLIPYLGVFVSGLTAVTVAYFQKDCWNWKFESGNWVYVFVVLGVYVFMHFCETWFVTPRIQGRYTGLHPMTIIVSLLAWSLLLGGVLGALLAVPLTAILKVLMLRYVWGEGSSTRS